MKLLIDHSLIDPHKIEVGEVYETDGCIEIITRAPYIGKTFNCRGVKAGGQWQYDSRGMFLGDSAPDLLDTLDPPDAGLPARVYAIIPDDGEEYRRIMEAEEGLEPNVLGILWEPVNLEAVPEVVAALDALRYRFPERSYTGTDYDVLEQAERAIEKLKGDSDE